MISLLFEDMESSLFLLQTIQFCYFKLPLESRQNPHQKRQNYCTKVAKNFTASVLLSSIKTNLILLSELVEKI